MSGTDIVFVIDTSPSMSAKDMEPVEMLKYIPFLEALPWKKYSQANDSSFPSYLAFNLYRPLPH